MDTAIEFISKDWFRKHIHTTISTLDPWFITGLVEIEGSFIIGLFKSNSSKMDYKILTIFKIFIHKKDQDLDLLCQVKIYFRLGKITKHAETI